MAYRYDTYCGLYCGACEVLRANKTDKLKIVAKKWSMRPSDITCHGCKSAVHSIYCKDCDIKKCAQEKNIEFCFECKKFPCKKIVALKNDKDPHHSIILNNLNTIKQKGKKAWLRMQTRRWCCKKCGARFSWYAKKCDKCGELTYDCVREEKELNRQ